MASFQKRWVGQLRRGRRAFSQKNHGLVAIKAVRVILRVASFMTRRCPPPWDSLRPMSDGADEKSDDRSLSEAMALVNVRASGGSRNIKGMLRSTIAKTQTPKFHVV